MKGARSGPSSADPLPQRVAPVLLRPAGVLLLCVPPTLNVTPFLPAFRELFQHSYADEAEEAVLDVACGSSCYFRCSRPA